jgi:2-keto-3-deoxy-6-phosphogluconate aldolase
MASDNGTAANKPHAVEAIRPPIQRAIPSSLIGAGTTNYPE